MHFIQRHVPLSAGGNEAFLCDCISDAISVALPSLSFMLIFKPVFNFVHCHCVSFSFLPHNSIACPQTMLRQEKIAQRLETEALGCHCLVWNVRVMEGDSEERWIPQPGPSPPSHCSWARAARRLPVPATPDWFLLSVTLGWAKISITISTDLKSRELKINEWNKIDLFLASLLTTFYRLETSWSGWRPKTKQELWTTRNK